MNDQRTKIMSHSKSNVVTIPMTRSSIVVCKTHLQVGNGNTGSNVFVFGLVLRHRAIYRPTVAAMQSWSYFVTPPSTLDCTQIRHRCGPRVLDE